MVCCQGYPLQGFSGISQQMHAGQGAYAVKYFKRQMFLGVNSGDPTIALPLVQYLDALCLHETAHVQVEGLMAPSYIHCNL